MSGIPVLTRQTLRLLIQNVKGFTPPPEVAALNGSVDLDLVLGNQMLWTAAAIQAPLSYGLLNHWTAFTLPNKSPHRFVGSSIGEDSELSGDLSSPFSKLVGLAFLGEYAKATWFKVLRPLWDETLVTVAGSVKIAKKTKDDGPDYLAAPFDPSAKAYGGPFYSVEFKGKKAKTELDSDAFRAWSTQAANISLTDTSTNAPVNIKAWTLGFNYGFEKPVGSREESALLVEDPETAPGADALEPERLNASSIIREHLARQCTLLGASAIAPYIRIGQPLRGGELPPVYKINHPRLKDRRYIGNWFITSPSGELLLWRPWPGTGWETLADGPNWFVLRRGNEHVEMHVSGRGRVGFRELVSDSTAVFIGQDATMLRRCTQVANGHVLDGEPFEDELHFVETGESRYPISVRVIRNGSVMASSHAVELDEAPFWT